MNPCDAQNRGTQMRKVWCLRRDGSALLTVDDSKCDPNLKPLTEQKCEFPQSDDDINPCERYVLQCTRDVSNIFILSRVLE